MAKKRFIVVFFLLFTLQLLARHAVTLPASQIAQLHSISTIVLTNDEGIECLIPKDSLSLLPALQGISNTPDQPIMCGSIPSATLETLSQALWSFYYARDLPAFEIMQHICQDAYLPWLSPEELTAIHQTAQALRFELLAQLTAIPLVNLVSGTENEKKAFFAVPSEQVMQSQKIRDFINSPAFSTSKEVVLFKISAEDLAILARALWALHEFKHLQDQGALLQAIINGSSWGTNAAEKFKTAGSVLKTASAIESSILATLAAQVLISQGSEDQVNSFLAGILGTDLKASVTDKLVQIKPKDDFVNGHEALGFTIKERWALSKHELLFNRLKGTRFDLSDYHIRDLEGLHLLPNVHTVTELILSDNKFKEVNLKHLESFGALTMIDLSHNSLKTLDASPLLSLTNLRTLKLRDNQFSEDAKQKIIQQLSAKNIDLIF